MKFEHTEVFNIAGALRGMRNPMNSWHLSDSEYKTPCVLNREGEYCETCVHDTCRSGFIESETYVVGKNDMSLAQKLIRAGSEHRKFLRQIFIVVDITAPLYWWKEFDTYKVGTVANSQSTMHKIASHRISLDCFEIADYDNSLGMVDDINVGVRIENFIDDLEQLRQMHLYYKDMAKDSSENAEMRQEYEELAKKYWKELIRWLPESWLQTRTVTLNYENILSIIKQRKHHKLSEWSTDFMKWAKELPYAYEFLIEPFENAEAER